MRLLVASHKETWRDPASPSGFATIGGFPLQMQALSEAFDETTIAVPVFSGAPPAGALPLTGHRLSILPLPAPAASGWRRQAGMAAAMPLVLARLGAAMARADAVHAVVPGDVGLVGLSLAIAAGKPLFARHCGTWGARRTPAERTLMTLLERYAGGRRVVMATGGAPTPPCAGNPAVDWIFSTSLRAAEIAGLRQATPWRPGAGPVELVVVARLDPGKNVGATIDALALLRARPLVPPMRLHVIGDGPLRAEWQAQAAKNGLGDQVVFHGRLGHDAVMSRLAQSHLFVHPTRVAEGFPKAVLEAMAAGLPVVATRVSVIPELLEPTGAGVILDATDAAAVADALAALLSRPDRLPAMAAAARAKSLAYTLEAWRDTIGARCAAAWGRPTRATPA